jgi:lysozyme family protein
MAEFNIAYELTVDAEGLYSNDEGDSGGETVLGLTRNTDGDWNGWYLVDELKKQSNFPNNLQASKSILHSLAMPYYKKKYWDKIRGDEIINQQVANRIYDTYVNAGSMGITLAQRALDIAESGHMDNATLNVLNNQA